MGKRCDWTKRIDRDELLKAIGHGQKIPQRAEGYYRGITLTRAQFGVPVQLTNLTIVLRMGTVKARKSSEHRTFVVCERCSALVPTGRYHQHFGKGTCNNGSQG